MKYYRLGSSAPRIRTRQPYEYGVSKKKYKYTIGALLGDGSLDVPGSLPEQGGGGGGGSAVLVPGLIFECDCCGVSCTIFSDDYNRADGDPGDNWDIRSGSFAISSNTLVSSGGLITPLIWNETADPGTEMTFEMKGPIGAHALITLGPFSVDIIIGGCLQILGGCQPYQKAGPATANTWFDVKICYGQETSGGVVADPNIHRLYVAVDGEEYQMRVDAQTDMRPYLEVIPGSQVDFDNFSLIHHIEDDAYTTCNYCEKTPSCVFFGDGFQNTTASATKVPVDCNWIVVNGTWTQNNTGLYTSSSNARINCNTPNPYCTGDISLGIRVEQLQAQDEIKFFIGDEVFTLINSDSSGSGKIVMSSWADNNHCIWWGGSFSNYVCSASAGNPSVPANIDIRLVGSWLSEEIDTSHIIVNGIYVGTQYLQFETGVVATNPIFGVGTGTVAGEIYFKTLNVGEQTLNGVDGGVHPASSILAVDICETPEPHPGGDNLCYQDFRDGNFELGERWTASGWSSGSTTYGNCASTTSAGTLTWKGETTYSGKINFSMAFHLMAPGDALEVAMGGHTWKWEHNTDTYFVGKGPPVESDMFSIDFYIDGVFQYGTNCASGPHAAMYASASIACDTDTDWLAIGGLDWNCDHTGGCIAGPGYTPTVITPLGATDWSTIVITATAGTTGSWPNSEPHECVIYFMTAGEQTAYDNDNVCP